MTKQRVAFFADIHFQASLHQVQTDFGGPSRRIPTLTKQALVSIDPDLAFCLGDATAFGSEQDWQAYGDWKTQFDFPIYTIFGNHDRNYNVWTEDNSGLEFFTILGNVSDTKAMKLGNIIFILVSEEHNAESNGQGFTSTVPTKRFKFIEKILNQYAHSYNIFVLSHTPVMGTTVLSDEWICNDPWIWQNVSNNYLELYQQYPIVAHLSGHTHIDYRKKDRVKLPDGQMSPNRIGKFVNGQDHAQLPNNYFLNMPCVATSHGWLSGRSNLLRRLTKNSYQTWRTPFRSFYQQQEANGPHLWDFLIKNKVKWIGRSAMYYFDLICGKKKATLKTRWIEANQDDESYQLNFNYPYQTESNQLNLLTSDLSLRDHDGIIINHNHWFSIEVESARAEFSQFFQKSRKITGLEIISSQQIAYSTQWKGKTNLNHDWSDSWVDDPQKLGDVKAVLLSVDFGPKNNNQPILVDDLQLKFG